MIITLPEDLVKIEKTRKPRIKCFRFVENAKRMVIPGELMEVFSSEEYGIDVWLSPKEKAAYFKFVPKEKAFFRFNKKNGYVGCASFFQWAHNLEIPLFDDYMYEDYQIDKKNKIVKVNLERK